MNRKIAIATVTVAALLGTGAASTAAFAGDDAGQGGQGPAEKSSVQVKDRDEDAREAKAAKTTAAEAAAAAGKAAPGTVTSIGLDNDKQGLVWEADVVKGTTSHEVTLDAGTNKVLADHREQDDDGDTVPGGLSVSAADAAGKAAAHGTVTSVELDDDGKAGWEVETTDKNGKEHQLSVDPQSGKVTPVASDDDQDDRDDDKGDDRDDRDDD